MPLHSLRFRAAGPAARASLAISFAVLSATGLRAAEPGISLTQAWIRMIIPSRPAAGYFTLSNESGVPRQLVGAESSACGSLMLHESLSRGGVEEMDMVKSIPVPANATLTFSPGGYHLMCMSPTKDMKAGGSMPVTLRFADGGTITATFAVRGATGK